MNCREPRNGEVRRIHLLGCEYPGGWLWATPRTGLTLLLGEPKVPCARLVTLTAPGLRSGRERNSHTPFGGAGEMLGRGQTFGMRKGLTLGACKDVSFVTRPSSSRPTVFVKARQIAPALSAVRKRRRVNLVPIAEPYTTHECLLTIWSP